jgi:hydrogenase 3 maturation protease
MDYFEDLERKLKTRLSGIPADRIVFVGAGNRSRGDDAIGPLIIDMLVGCVPHAIDAGPSPENVTGAIKKLKPAVIVLIDALIFKDLPPGAPQIVEIDDIRHLGESTHTLSLDVVMEYLKMETGADVFMIGIQPKRIADGEGLSQGIEQAIKKVVVCIRRSLGVT